MLNDPKLRVEQPAALARLSCMAISGRNLTPPRAFAAVLLFLLGAALFPATAPAQDPIQAPAKSQSQASHQSRVSLRVAYFGRLETDRGKDFIGFLKAHFTRVGQGNLETFAEKDAAGYDVVILDYDELKVTDNRIQMPPIPFCRQYSRPTVTLGATGALVSDRLNLKTGYL